jgi:hypothetical protein
VPSSNLEKKRVEASELRLLEDQKDSVKDNLVRSSDPENAGVEGPRTEALKPEGIYPSKCFVAFSP